MIDKQIENQHHSKFTIYLCGPTVYNKAHIGNMRPIIVFDIFTRVRQMLNKPFLFIHNVTDIDDKIIAQALQENVSEQEISTRYTDHYCKLLKQLNINRPQLMPTVTENIKVIIDFIQKLIENKTAYVVNGNVWFDVRSISNYGELSHQKLANLQFETHDEKRFPADFALWKKTAIGITFNSPWGQGRPGWHTECVAMINKIMNGQPLSIHGGGIDLLFPHHENETAQYFALHATNNQNYNNYQTILARAWIHVGHVNVNDIKMSKSLNNVIDTEDFIHQYGVDTLRMIYLMSSPTSPINLTEQIIHQAQDYVHKFNKIFIQAQLNNHGNKSTHQTDQKSLREIAANLESFSFPNALSCIWEKIHQFHIDKNNGHEIMKIMQLLGFNFAMKLISSQDKELYQEWIRLREAKNFEKSDVIRQQLINKKLI